MTIIVSETKQQLGKAAAEKGSLFIRKAIQEKGEATIIVATGASQFEMLSELVEQDLEWEKVRAFHLDEYIGIDAEHPASFRKYLKERFVNRVPLKEFIYINGQMEPVGECQRLNALISGYSIDVAFVGIGENSHLAFNDPPADFLTEHPYIIVDLDHACRKQQLNEGWFHTLQEVPGKAISMSVHQIMKSNTIICSVPDERKAKAVKLTVEGPVTPEVPASILRKHNNCYLYLDKQSAGKITNYQSE